MRFVKTVWGQDACYEVGMKRDAIGLQVSLDLEDKNVVVVGGGAEAEDKVQRLLDAGARITVLAKQPGMRLESLAIDGRIALFPREFSSGELNDADFVLVCERDAALAEKVMAAAEERGLAVWACDDPEHSHMAMPAIAKLGRGRVAVTTSGAAPALAGKIRAALERDLGARFAEFVERLGRERARLLVEEPDPEKRREKLRALVEGFDLSIAVRYPDEV